MVLLGSCTKNIADATTKATADRSSAELLSNGNQSVTGGGTTEEGSELSTFTFNAVNRKADGTITGHLIYHIRTGDISVKIDIDCLTVAGNRARMSGNCTKIWGPGEVPWWITVGSRVSFIVEDNGQGNSASPDMISDLIFYIGIPPTGCANVDAFRTYLPMSGNIQIHN